MSRRIRIGIDYHGVITADPSFFRDFSRLALEHGCEVYVLSGGAKKDIQAYLERQGIPYSFIWSMLDYFAGKNMVTYLADGSFKVDDKAWNVAKANYCVAHKIDFHIDDSVLYGKAFLTPFCLYNFQNKNCKLDNKFFDIDFKAPAAKVLDVILALINQQNG